MRRIMLILPDVINGRWYPRGTIFPNEFERDSEAIMGHIMEKERGIVLDDEPIIATEEQKQEIITFVQEQENAQDVAKKERRQARNKDNWQVSVKASKEK